ncbi:MAG: 5'/3'-nucleotidase SurE [Lentisphaerae bacterium]|nr:5'/3'-nucleotidase SurE [Lentisphaerota bacterium]
MRPAKTRLSVVALLLAAMQMFSPASALGQDTQTPHRLRVLITNDDGFQAPGLLALVDSLLPIADITVVAPYEQQSGTGHGISFRDPINVYEFGNAAGIPWYAVNARPATVVRVALFSLLDSLPDLVIAGINTGDNVGTNAWVSGTMAAAREAALSGLPALAFSVNLTGPDPYNVAAGWARRVVDKLIAEERIRAPLLLNVNLQAEEPLGIRVAPMSLVTGEQSYDRRISPAGQNYLWAEWSAPEDDPLEGTDLYWFARGYVTITPLQIDQTDSQGISEMELLFKRQ